MRYLNLFTYFLIAPCNNQNRDYNHLLTMQFHAIIKFANCQSYQCICKSFHWNRTLRDNHQVQEPFASRLNIDQVKNKTDVT